MMQLHYYPGNPSMIVHILLDAYALVPCRWTRGFAHPARSRPVLGAYLQRMLARPVVQRVFATEKLPPPFV